MHFGGCHQRASGPQKDTESVGPNPAVPRGLVCTSMQYGGCHQRHRASVGPNAAVPRGLVRSMEAATTSSTVCSMEAAHTLQQALQQRVGPNAGRMLAEAQEVRESCCAPSTHCTKSYYISSIVMENVNVELRVIREEVGISSAVRSLNAATLRSAISASSLGRSTHSGPPRFEISRIA